MLTQKQMFDLSRSKWGLESQVLMMAEEASELATASLHLLRANKNKEVSLVKFAEEIADTMFLIDEMLYYFQNVSLVAQFRKQKEQNLIALLETNT